NLSRLSVWWLRLGIAIERIKPGHPQQNGRHERMHLTLKLETTKPAARTFPEQQARFDDFIDGFNNERPHQSLNMQVPAQRYQPAAAHLRKRPCISKAGARSAAGSPAFTEIRLRRAHDALHPPSTWALGTSRSVGGACDRKLQRPRSDSASRPVRSLVRHRD